MMMVMMITGFACTPFLSDFGHAENGQRTSSLNASLKFEGSGRAGSLFWLAPEILAGTCS
jgi:hypothetical protein